MVKFLEFILKVWALKQLEIQSSLSETGEFIVPNQLEKVYDYNGCEKELYEFWEKNGFFRSEVNNSKKAYVVAMPPPNVTGQLHMGHAMDDTIQDILIRFKRMKGSETLWIPGTDHAAIATEAKIVEEMRKEGITKDELGREGFLKRAWAWKEKYGNKIKEQVRKLGASCDWSKERFTMDEGCCRAVKECFVRLYKKGLIYRGERIINWCPKCLTSISDIEVNFEERESGFWYIRYKLADGSGFVQVATTRPETILGDTALAVNPKDERYEHLIGKTAIVPLANREIPIIADEYVEKDFGTGVVKITPAHDPNDFEVGRRHNLPTINILDENAVLNENAGTYKGLGRDEARGKIVSDLEGNGYLVKREDIKHNVGTCYRCSCTIEPRASVQWFVKMGPLSKPAIDLVKEGKVKFVPERFNKIYYNWLENVKDWCISRQLWWGHRIPAWYCNQCGHITVSVQTPKECEKCKSKDINQDEDIFDTWFSAALWPFSILGWPHETRELDYYYPTDTLVTGYDIIFFWVARMVFMSKELLGKEPFKNVFIHGLVRDSQGRKMSKSLGNGIDPLEIIDKYGTDALRFTLVSGNSPGNDLRFSDDKILASRSFANKIWNAARFIHMTVGDEIVANTVPTNLNKTQKWILNRFNKVVKEVNSNIEKFELGIAVQKIYEFTWDEFCDWYIEFAKIEVKTQKEDNTSTYQMLVYLVQGLMQLLHPFMPYITEKIWLSFPHTGKSIMVSRYPEYDPNISFEQEENELKGIMELIRAIRNRRNEMNVPVGKKINIYLAGCTAEDVTSYSNFIKSLAGVESISFQDAPDTSKCITIVASIAKVYIPMDQLIDKEAESLRLNKELENAKVLLSRTNAQLENSSFVEKAPSKVVEGVRENALKLQEKIKKLEEEIALMQ